MADRDVSNLTNSKKYELIYSFVFNYVLTITSIFKQFLVTGQDIQYVWIPSIYGLFESLNNLWKSRTYSHNFSLYSSAME